MRLIDADRLFHNLERGVRNASNEVFREIANTPTVNAIPIEFIEEQIAKTTDISNSDELDVLYAGNLVYLLKLWEAECGADK